MEKIAQSELRVLLLSKPYDSEVDEHKELVIKFLEKHQITFYTQAIVDESDSKSSFLDEVNVIIALGGDGTILYAVKMFYNRV